MVWAGFLACIVMPTEGPSAAGRRIALDRKFAINIAHYGGAIRIVTITPPGQDLLPWDEGRRLVNRRQRVCWESTAQARMSRLFEAAQANADRWVRRAFGSGVKLPRQIANVRSPQARGVSHWHYALPMATELERVWTKTVYGYLRSVANRESSVDPFDRYAALELEHVWGRVTPTLYGFGFVHPGKSRGGSSVTAAKYLSRNAAGYLSLNSAGGRHYVSARLVSETGATMRTLRACNHLFMRRKLGIEPWIPRTWDAEWSTRVLRIWAMTQPSLGP